MERIDIREERLSTEAKGKISAGLIRISFMAPAEAGETVITDWIDTGLGSSVVLLQAETMLHVKNITYFGKEEFFQQEKLMPDVQISKMLNNADGCFKVAIRFAKDYFGSVLCLKWVALAAESDAALKTAAQEAVPAEAEECPPASEPVCESAADPEAEPESMPEPVPESEPVPEIFYIENPPKLLHPGWKYTLRTNLGTDSKKVTWYVPEGAGVIDSYGEYTAPERQGLYEVTAFYDNGAKKATVYVVVMK